MTSYTRSVPDLVVIVVVVVLFAVATSSKSLKLRSFKLDRDEIWQDCSPIRPAETQ